MNGKKMETDLSQINDANDRTIHQIFLASHLVGKRIVCLDGEFQLHKNSKILRVDEGDKVLIDHVGFYPGGVFVVLDNQGEKFDLPIDLFASHFLMADDDDLYGEGRQAQNKTH